MDPEHGVFVVSIDPEPLMLGRLTIRDDENGVVLTPMVRLA